jgi:hypothetical protein
MSIDFEAIGQAYGVTPEAVELIVKAAQVDRRGAMGAGVLCWIDVDSLLPEKRDSAYQVIAVCTKTYGKDTNYPGQGVKGVYQDWVIRQWPGNFTHWMPLPALDQRRAASGAVVLSDDMVRAFGNRHDPHLDGVSISALRCIVDDARSIERAPVPEKGGL